jgi:hypothetical protein
MQAAVGAAGWGEGEEAGAMHWGGGLGGRSSSAGGGFVGGGGGWGGVSRSEGGVPVDAIAFDPFAGTCLLY